jgi:hypothetical protein
MGLFDRLRKKDAPHHGHPTPSAAKPQRAPYAGPEPTLPDPWPTTANAQFGGELDVVGEMSHADNLTAVVGPQNQSWSGVVVLLPEPRNEFDANAISVHAEGRRVGYVPKELAANYQTRLLQMLQQQAYIAVDALILSGGGYWQVVLEPELLQPLSRPRLAHVLLSAGFTPRSENAGYSLKFEDSRVRVLCTGGDANERDELVPMYAKALRDAGYKARVAREYNYPYVSVTGLAD